MLYRRTLGAGLSLFLAGRSLDAQVRLPTIIGPIAVTAAPGDRSHNYPYGSTAHWLVPFGYSEAEYFVEGVADQYLVDGRATATKAAGGPYPYRTRVTVRRPRNAARFNGTVILEWNTVSGDQDKENEWIWSHQHLMRAGYAHVGVSAQALGVESPDGLKQWNPARYGTLDVNAGGRFASLSYEIFSQVAAALKHPSGLALLGALRVRSIIASGHSSSATQLRFYYNSMQPVAQVIDGFVLHGVGPALLRDDLATPAWKLLAEGDGERSGPRQLQADNPRLRTWQVAGAAHAGRDLIDSLDAIFARDFPDRVVVDSCALPPLNEVPIHLVLDAVYDGMKRWIERGVPPPPAPPLRSRGRGADPDSLELVRDAFGIAEGGIRLPQVSVPTATNTGFNSGSRFCKIYGSRVPFPDSTLARLYPTHAGYVAAVRRAAAANLRAGYITKEGAAALVAAAERSTIGRN